MKYIFSVIFFFLFLMPVGFAQKKNLRFELGIASENDSYLMFFSDRYYTNGVFIDFLMSLHKSEVSSSSLEFSIQHRLYNGVPVLMGDLTLWDRPFSAVLSFKSTFRHFINQNRQIGLSLNLEQVGPKAIGDEVQNFFHKTFNFYEVNGWETQLPNALGIDIGVNYMEEFYTNPSNSIAIGGSLDAVVGMNNTYFQAGIPLRIGKFKKYNRSVFTKANINSSELNDEFFVFYKPSLTYQIRNSSTHNSDLVDLQYPDNSLQPYMFTQQLGITFAKKKTSLSFSISRYSKEMKEMRYRHHQFGRIQINRRF